METRQHDINETALTASTLALALICTWGAWEVRFAPLAILALLLCGIIGYMGATKK